MKRTQEHDMSYACNAAWDFRRGDLRRIEGALQAASDLCKNFICDMVQAESKAGGELVTVVDRAVDELLREMLPRDGEGWLSEETPDDWCRLASRRVWVVDPLDGTKEFLRGIPEWCVSVALVEDEEAVAGGICNPATGEMFIGSREIGIRYWPRNHQSLGSSLRGKPVVLASRSEVARGEWDWLKEAPLEVRTVGSIAYKLALVAVGRAEATWTFVPKNEWDIAAGVALVEAGGGTVKGLDGQSMTFNQLETGRDGLIAFSADGQNHLSRALGSWLSGRS
jgi:myo-inositol-1(or 4)-monophosphatase